MQMDERVDDEDIQRAENSYLYPMHAMELSLVFLEKSQPYMGLVNTRQSPP